MNSNRFNSSLGKLTNDNLNITKLLKNSNINSDYTKACIN